MAQTLLSRTPRAQLPAQFHLAWDTLDRLTGEPTFVEVFAQAPELLDFVMNQFYMKVFFGGRVDNRYKQLVRLKLSLEHGCRTCNKQNVPGALEAGITQAQIDAMDDPDNGPFTAAERAVIHYAEQMVLTNHDGALSPELHRDLREHFSDADILELGTCMAVIAGMAKLSFVLNLVEKETYCPFSMPLR
ncbi:MAG TPA: carboxymuconolactone decarboxylase family protein [Steroidobacteraceae bacterium]|nr:carboxymuconolactone decarboxylase family protein [Steroidobacteraceae bacterium]